VPFDVINHFFASAIIVYTPILAEKRKKVNIENEKLETRN